MSNFSQWKFSYEASQQLLPISEWLGRVPPANQQLNPSYQHNKWQKHPLCEFFNAFMGKPGKCSHHGDRHCAPLCYPIIRHHEITTGPQNFEGSSKLFEVVKHGNSIGPRNPKLITDFETRHPRYKIIALYQIYYEPADPMFTVHGIFDFKSSEGSKDVRTDPTGCSGNLWWKLRSNMLKNLKTPNT